MCIPTGPMTWLERHARALYRSLCCPPRLAARLWDQIQPACKREWLWRSSKPVEWLGVTWSHKPPMCAPQLFDKSMLHKPAAHHSLAATDVGDGQVDGDAQKVPNVSDTRCSSLQPLCAAALAKTLMRAAAQRTAPRATALARTRIALPAAPVQSIWRFSLEDVALKGHGQGQRSAVGVGRSRHRWRPNLC